MKTQAETDVHIYSRLSLSQSPRDSLKYFQISVLRHIRFADLRKKCIEQPNFTNEYVIWLLKLEIHWKYCGKEEKLLFFIIFCYLLLEFHVENMDHIFTSRYAVIQDKRIRDNECRLYLNPRRAPPTLIKWPTVKTLVRCMGVQAGPLFADAKEGLCLDIHCSLTRAALLGPCGYIYLSWSFAILGVRSSDMPSLLYTWFFLTFAVRRSTVKGLTRLNVCSVWSGPSLLEHAKCTLCRLVHLY